MLKYILCFSVCLFALAMPSFADLTQQDLNEIRKVIKEEIEKEIMPIKTEIASVKREVTRVRGKLDRFGKDIIRLIAIIAVAGIIPQSIIAWRKRKVRLQEKQIQEKKIQAALIAEAEKLKQQRIVNP
jgi:septal ring factor EnvC (AmiA/AmiB activator)